MARAKISSFTSTVEKTTSECPEPFWAFGMLLVGMAMCGRADEHDDFAFSDLSVAVRWWERLHCKSKWVVLTTEWLPWLQTNWRNSGYESITLVLKSNCIRKPKGQLPSSSYNHNTLKTLITSLTPTYGYESSLLKCICKDSFTDVLRVHCKKWLVVLTSEWLPRLQTSWGDSGYETFILVLISRSCDHFSQLTPFHWLFTPLL